MKIFFLSNFFPPFARGGYEQWCQEVAVELVRRGHQVSVLTSRAHNNTGDSGNDSVQVHRLLTLEIEQGLFNTVMRLLRDREELEQRNLSRVQKLISDFQPDVGLIWGMWNVPRSVPALVEQLLPGRVAYYLCDYWLSLPNAYIQRLQAPARQTFAQWPKQLLSNLFLPQMKKEASIPLKLEYPICVSKAVRQSLIKAGVSIEHAQVIYGGTQIEEFITTAANKIHSDNGDCLKLLYVGRLDVEKGVHTIIRAMRHLHQSNLSITLNIVGKGSPDYEAELKALIQQYDLKHIVSFKGHVSRSEIPDVLAQYDALIFSSEWEEPFARTVLEAMAAGLVVIGTTTGGTGEILSERKTGLTFPAGDAEALARQIQLLFDDLSLRKQLSKAGQQRVMEQFTFQRMVDQIETTLQSIAYER